MKLIPMTDFVTEIRKQGDVTPFEDEQIKIDLNNLQLIFKYARFLKQSLTLGMFVPCDEDGNVLEEPKCEHSFDEHGEPIFYYTGCNHAEYERARCKVLFRGFELSKTGQSVQKYKDKTLLVQIGLDDIKNIRTVEVLSDILYNDLELTENAIKHLGL